MMLITKKTVAKWSTVGKSTLFQSLPFKDECCRIGIYGLGLKDELIEQGVDIQDIAARAM